MNGAGPPHFQQRGIRQESRRELPAEKKPAERQGAEGKEKRSGQGTEGERDNARGEPEGEDAGVGMGREEGRYRPLFIANVSVLEEGDAKRTERQEIGWYK